MHLNEVLYHSKGQQFESQNLNLIKQECSRFLEQAQDLPLLKNLPQSYNDFHRVKVRKRKKKEKHIEEAFNNAFDNEHKNLRERAIFANGPNSFQKVFEDQINEPFYIFPIDQFKFMYCTEVTNSKDDYKHIFETLFDEFGDDKGQEVISDMLKYTYTTENLYEGIEKGSEIIIYNVPYYYAVRSSIFEDYQTLLSTIKNR